MTNNKSNPYQDIINSPRPKSKHPKMSLEKRAKIFQPFESLGTLNFSTNPKKYHENLRFIPSDPDNLQF